MPRPFASPFGYRGRSNNLAPASSGLKGFNGNLFPWVSHAEGGLTGSGWVSDSPVKMAQAFWSVKEWAFAWSVSADSMSLSGSGVVPTGMSANVTNSGQSNGGTPVDPLRFTEDQKHYTSISFNLDNGSGPTDDKIWLLGGFALSAGLINRDSTHKWATSGFFSAHVTTHTDRTVFPYIVGTDVDYDSDINDPSALDYANISILGDAQKIVVTESVGTDPGLTFTLVPNAFWGLGDW